MSRGTVLSDAVHLAREVHVVPEFLGNRAPFANPRARAVSAGLGMETDLDSLVALYIVGLCGIGYGLRQIIGTHAAHGARIRRVMISGGAGQHDLVRQLLADATGVAVVSTRADEPVLLGAAMLGAVAGGLCADVVTAMTEMSSISQTFEPALGPEASVHSARFAAFKRLQAVAHGLPAAKGQIARPTVRGKFLQIVMLATGYPLMVPLRSRAGPQKGATTGAAPWGSVRLRRETRQLLFGSCNRRRPLSPCLLRPARK